MVAAGDVIVDGGNANYRDSKRRAESLAARGIHFVDAGVSGGVWGLANGYAIMFGGAPAAARIVEPVIRALAPTPDTGWLHCGPAGSGHFVKMVHNGIEYGMMQALAEGLSLHGGEARVRSRPRVRSSEMWRHGSVVRSWLLDLTAEFLRDGAALEDVKPFVADSGEGRWTALEAIELGVPGAGDEPVAHGALREPGQGRLRVEAARADARGLRRSRGEAMSVVVLMGVAGCGKTTVGVLLAERLGWTLPRRRRLPPAGQRREDAQRPSADRRRSLAVARPTQRVAARRRFDGARLLRPQAEAIATGSRPVSTTSDGCISSAASN